MLSNTDQISAAMSAYDIQVARALEASECVIDEHDSIVWHGLTIGMLSSRGDWTTGEVTDVAMVFIRGLPIEKEFRANCVIHGVEVKVINYQQSKGYWHR